MLAHRGVDNSRVRRRHHAENNFRVGQRGGDVRGDVYLGRYSESRKIDIIFARLVQRRAEFRVMHPQRNCVRTPAAAENYRERRAPASSADDGNFFHELILCNHLILMAPGRTVKRNSILGAVHQPRNIRAMAE